MSTILIVEDDRDIAFALATRLRAAGLSPAHAYDAIAGVAQARKTNPDLVLLDLMMPAGGGLKVAERLRALEATSTTPVIFMTASKDQELRDAAMQYQPFAFVEKPYNAAELLSLIHQALGMASPATAG